MRLLLDTQIAVWALEDNPQLKPLVEQIPIISADDKFLRYRPLIEVID